MKIRISQKSKSVYLDTSIIANKEDLDTKLRLIKVLIDRFLAIELIIKDAGEIRIFNPPCRKFMKVSPKKFINQNLTVFQIKTIHDLSIFTIYGDEDLKKD